jgi:DNA-directed RNA polymerase subunit N (RpoN/RPB10)
MEGQNHPYHRHLEEVEVEHQHQQCLEELGVQEVLT